MLLMALKLKSVFVLNKNNIIEIFVVVYKIKNMESDERGNTKKTRNTVSYNGDISKPIWVRPSCLQIDTINERLLDYNAYIICCCGPILYLILSFI